MSQSGLRFVGLLLLSQTLFVGSTFGTWMPVIAAAILSISTVVARHRWGQQPAQSDRRSQPGRPRWRRWLGVGAQLLLFVTMACGTAVWRMAMQVGEDINLIYVGIDVLAHVALFASLLVWAIRPWTGNVSMLPLGLVLMLLCVAAGGASSSISAQTTVGLAACLGFAAAAQVILGSRREGARGVFSPSSDASGKVSWVGPLVSLLTLSVLLMSTSAIASATTRALPYIQNKLQERLDATFGNVAEETRYIGGTRYVRGSSLGSIRQHMLGQPEEIAIRAYADVAPGYLRGNVFDIYRRRRWLVVSESQVFGRRTPESARERTVKSIGEGSVQLEQPVEQLLHRFPLAEQSNARTVNIEIHNDPQKGPVVFLPLTTRWIEAVSGELVVNQHHVVRPSVNLEFPYVAGVSTTGLRETLNEDSREFLLYVPDSISDSTRRVAREVCANQPTTRGKADAVSQFFQSKFAYSLSFKTPRGSVDPIKRFLDIRHDAHCEYFASATVMVLRSAGVPARYVTGYVVDEFNEETLRWVARNRDAHAWCEAYDEETSEWFPVESTPGRVYQSVTEESALQTAAGLIGAYGTNDNDEGNSLLSRFSGWLLSFRLTEPLFLIYRIVQVPLFLALLFILWSKYLRPHHDGADPVDQQSRRMLRKVDRTLQKHSLVRTPSETLFQFADRIDAHRLDDEKPLHDSLRGRMGVISDWYRQYASARYRGKMPKPLT